MSWDRNRLEEQILGPWEGQQRADLVESLHLSTCPALAILESGKSGRRLPSQGLDTGRIDIFVAIQKL